MERPNILKVEEGDTEYQKGYKDVYQQMLIQESLTAAMKTECVIHVYDAFKGNRCMRCNKPKETI
jgi:hypothetical protein